MTTTVRSILTLLAVFGAALLFALTVRAGTADAATRPAHPDRATCRAFTRWYAGTEDNYRPSPVLAGTVTDRAQYAGRALREWVAHWAAHHEQEPYTEAVLLTCTRVLSH